MSLLFKEIEEAEEQEKKNSETMKRYWEEAERMVDKDEEGN